MQEKLGKSIVWTIRITRPYLVWGSLEIKKIILSVSDGEEKSHKRKDWMVSIAWAICPLLGENKTENAPFLQYRLGD